MYACCSPVDSGIRSNADRDMTTPSQSPVAQRPMNWRAVPPAGPHAGRQDAGVRVMIRAVADELFYEEGVYTVGIDRAIEKAGVAKATLYSAFGSKDELVRAR
jgi:Bacterial regulatory proteins, tetR family